MTSEGFAVNMSNPLYTAIESIDKIDILFSIAILWANFDFPEAVIPERQPKPPPPAEPDLQAQERSRLNRERLDQTGRLPRGTDPNEASGVQLEIPTVPREPVRAPATSLLPPAPDVGTAPQPGETGEQLTLPFGTGAGAGSTRVVTPRDFIAQETRKQEARPSTSPDTVTAPPEVEVVSDMEAIQTVRRAPVVTGKTKYTPDGAAQYYVAAFGDDVDMMLRTIAYDTSTPMKGNVQKGFKKETGYVTDNKRGNAAAQWVRNNFSPTSISALEKHIRDCLLYTSPSPRDVEESGKPGCG